MPAPAALASVAVRGGCVVAGMAVSVGDSSPRTAADVAVTASAAVGA